MIRRITIPPFAGIPWFDRAPGMTRGRRGLALAAILVIAAIVAGSLVLTRGRAAAAYATAPAAYGTLSQSVTAAGTVTPQNTVNVGTQVSGTISEIDVDYNSRVHKGEVLATIDTSQMQAQLAQAQASLAQARAQAAAQQQTAAGSSGAVNVAQADSAAQSQSAVAARAAIATAQAGVTKAQSALQLAQQTVARDKTLLAQGYIAQNQYDSDATNLTAAQTALQAAQAAVVQARAQAASSASQAAASSAQSGVAAAQAGAASDSAAAAAAGVNAAQAQVQQDQLNLNRAVITSPVDGTVIARDVSVGQTVAASLQTPTLFEIAQNLHRMEVDISVGEPDIGNVRAGDPVAFSVLAYPGQTFRGTVSQVRVAPATVNNVVTYTVVTLVNNPNDQLLPGMTANASIQTRSVRDALIVPSSSLQFHPANAGTNTPRGPWGAMAASAAGAAADGSRGVVYVERGGRAIAVPVRIGLSSGVQTAVTPLRGTLTAGDAVITGAATAASGAHPPASHGGGSYAVMRGLHG